MRPDAAGSRSTARLRSAWASAGRSATEHLATEAVVAYVDGELGMTAHQRAAAHLATCPECAAEVDCQQRARAAVRSAAPLSVPAGLQNLLCGIPRSQQRSLHQPASATPAPARAENAPQAPARHLLAVGRSLTSRRPRSRRAIPLAVATVSALAVGAVSMVVTSPSAPRSTPAARASTQPVVNAIPQSAKVPGRAVGASVSATSWAGQTRTSP